MDQELEDKLDEIIVLMQKQLLVQTIIAMEHVSEEDLLSFINQVQGVFQNEHGQ